jgi:hypothetical protein
VNPEPSVISAVFFCFSGSHDSVRIATGYWQRGRSSSPGGGKTFFFSTSYPVGAGAVSPGVKCQGRETDHSPHNFNLYINLLSLLDSLFDPEDGDSTFL